MLLVDVALVVIGLVCLVENLARKKLPKVNNVLLLRGGMVVCCL